jgi:putative SOS response-associated peptidase YedK
MRALFYAVFVVLPLHLFRWPGTNALPLDLFEQMLGEAINDRRCDVHPRYNIAPSQLVPIIRRNATGVLELVETRWGLIPFGARKPKLFIQQFQRARQNRGTFGLLPSILQK